VDKSDPALSMEVVEPKGFLETFNHLSPSMGLNASVIKLERDDNAVLEIMRTLRDQGQRRFVPLVKISSDALASVPLYAGNGIVFKIMAQSCSTPSESTLFKLPPITVDTVPGRNEDFLIKSYPWLSPRGVTRESLENLREVLESLGARIKPKECQPRNIHRLPDRFGTLISVDEDIYDGKPIDPVISDAWLDYIYSIFPIYEKGAIPPQDDQTDFSFVSIHDRKAAQYTFSGCRVVEAVRYDFQM
jgi:hypothetical protein